MAAIITDIFKKNILEKVFDAARNDSDKMYIGIGKSEQWDASETVPTPTDSIKTMRQLRSGLQSIKKAGDVSFVIPRHNWSSGSTYSAFDDEFTTIPSNTYYVLTDENQVYIVLRQSKTNAGVANPSTVKPTGTSTKPFRTLDGYVWKFLYSLSASRSSKFLSSNFVPIERVDSANDTFETQQKTIQDAASPGQILGIEVLSNGSGYTTATVTINGDGTGSTATATIDGTAITKIELDSSVDSAMKMGHGYNFASIAITGDGTGATARAIIGPDSGIGADPRTDLKSTSLMFNVKPDGTESTTQTVSGSTTNGSSFIVDQDFRQVALIKNPRDSAGVLYTGTSGKTLRYLEFATTSQASSFPKDTMITSASSAKAIVDDTDSARVWFHQNDSTGFKPFVEGETVTGGGGSGTLVAAGVDADNDAWEHGDVEKMSGEILYIENRAPVVRSANQTEDIKVVITL